MLHRFFFGLNWVAVMEQI